MKTRISTLTPLWIIGCLMVLTHYNVLAQCGSISSYTPLASATQVCSGNSVTLSAYGMAVKRWVYQDNNTGAWITLTSGNNVQTATNSATATTSNLVRTYRAIVSTPSCPSDTSQGISVVFTAPSYGNNNALKISAASYTVCANSSVSLSVMGVNGTVAGWVYKNSTSLNWSILTSSSSETITDYNTSVSNPVTRLYKALIRTAGSCQIDSTSEVSINLIPLTSGFNFGYQPTTTASTFCGGSTINLSVDANAQLIENWIYRDSINGTWNAFGYGTPTTTQTAPNTSLTLNRIYRALLKNDCRIDSSADLNVTIIPAARKTLNSINPRVSSNITSVCAGTGFSVQLTGFSSSNVLQWIYRDSSDGAWIVNNTQSTSSSFSTQTNISKDLVREIRAIVNNASVSCSIDTSTAVYVTIKANKNGTTTAFIPFAPYQTVAAGASVAIQLTNGSVNARWIYRTNNAGNWQTGSTGNTYTDNNTSFTTNTSKSYRAIITSNANCTIDTTAEVSILYKVPGVGGSLAITPRMNASGYCVGTSPNGNISLNSTYYSVSKWLYRDNHNGPWVELPNQASSTFSDFYTSGITTPTTRSYRALIRNNETITLDSSEIVSTIISPVSRGNINSITPQPASLTNCSGNSLNIQVTIPNNYTVQNWIYRDSTIGNWIYLTGNSANIYDYNTTVSYNKTRYYRVIFYNSSICRYDTSGTVAVNLTLKTRGINNAVVPAVTSGSAIMCSNSQSLNMQVSLPPGATVQRWIVRDNNGPWVAASNTTTSTSYTEQSYNLAVYVPTTREYKVVFDNNDACTTDTSAATVVTLNPLVGGNTTSITPTAGVSTICPSTNSYVSLNSGTVQNWIYRDNNGVWNSLNQTGSSLSISYEKVAVNTVREYKAIVYRQGSCAVDTTQAAAINIYPVTIGNASVLTPTTSSPSFCSGVAANININISTGQSVRKWIYKDDNGPWVDFTNTTTGNNLYDNNTAVLNTTQRSYRAIIQQGNCSFDTTSALPVTINTTVYGNQLTAVPTSSSGAVCSGATVTVTLAGASGNVKKWIYRDDNGAWYDIPSSSSSTLNHTNTTVNSVTTRAYRAIINGTTCNVDSSAIYSITINPVVYGNLFSVTPNVSTQTVCAISSTNASLSINPPSNYSVKKWIMSDNNGPWMDFSYTTSNNNLVDYGIALQANTVRNYKAVLLNNITCSNDSSNLATVTINAQQAGNINTVTPASARSSYCFNSPVPVSVTTPSGYTIRKWIVKDNNEPWRDFDNSTTSTQLTDNNTAVAINTTRYYRVIFNNANTCASDSSVALAIAIKTRAATLGTSTIAPTSSKNNICSGDAASLNINPGNGNSVYKWIYSDNGAQGPWNDVLSTYNQSNISHSNTLVKLLTSRLYKAIITDTSACELDSSAAFTLTINPVTPGIDTAITITGLDTVCAGQSVSLNTSSGSGNTVVKWIYRDNNGPWTDFTNSTTSTSLFDNANNILGTLNSRSYRSIILKSATCMADSSRIKTVNFKQKVYGNSTQTVNISSGDTVCSGSSISVNTSGSVEKWLYRDGNGTWTPITSTSTFLTHSNTVVNGAVWRYYRAIISNTSSCTADSTAIDSVLIRNQQYGNNNSVMPVTAQTTYCAGSTITVNASMPSGSTFVKWIYRNGTSPWQDLSYSTTGVDYNTNIVAATSRSYRMIFSKNCSNDTSDAVTVTINIRTNNTNTALTPTAQSTTVCAGSPVNNISVAAGTGNSIIKWMFRDNNGPWIDLYNGNQNNFSDYNTYFGSSVSRDYRAIINNNTNCSYDTTAILAVTINPIVVGSNIAVTPTAQSTVCTGNNAVITVVPGSGNTVLRWTYNINGGPYIDWGYNTSNSITDYNSYVTTATTKSYRAVIYQSATCRIDTTPAVTVNFIPRTYGTDNNITPNGSSSVCSGFNTSLNVNAGTGNSIQKWIYMENNSGIWIDASYNNTVTVNNNGSVAATRVYHALIVKANQCSIDTSAGLTVTLNPRTYSSNSAISVTSTASVCTGSPISVSASNAGSIVGWLYRDNGGSWISYYTTGNSFTDNNTTTTSTINREYAVLSINSTTCVVDTGLTDTSVINPRTIGNDNSITPTATNSSGSVCTGSAVSLNVNAGSGNSVLKWVYMNNNDSNWLTLQNGNYTSVSDYNTSVQTATTRTYRAIITKASGCANDTSAGVNVTISPRTLGNDNSIVPSSSSNTYCSGVYYNVNVNLSGSNSVLKWMVSINNGAWTDLYNGNVSSIGEYANVTTSTTKAYRIIVVKGNGCTIDTSAVYTLTLSPAGYGNQNTVSPSGTANVCAGGAATVSVSGYTGNAVLRWIYKDNLADNWNELHIGSSTLADYNTNIAATTVRSYRAIINNPAGCSIDTTGIFNVTINPLVNGVVGTAAQSSQSTYCSGSAINLFINPSQGYVVNHWLQREPNGNWEVMSYTSATSVYDYNSTISVNSSKQYRAILRNTLGCSFDSSGIVNVNINIITEGNINTLTPSTSTPSVCSGNAAVVSVAGFSGSVVKWLYRDTTLGSWFTASGTGNTLWDNNTFVSYDRTRYYRAIIFNGNNCSNDTSNEVSVLLKQQLTGNAPGITPTASNNAICSGSAVTLSVTGIINGGVVTGWAYSDDGNTWTLINNSASINITHNSTTVSALTTRQYRALVLTGCSTDSTAILTITIDVYPAKPTITNPASSDSLVCDADAATYQWKLAGNTINGATNKVYIPTESGSYTVEIGNAAGCKTLSDAFVYTKVGLNEVLGNASFSLYPNPTNNGFVHIDLTLVSSETVTLTVFDMVGKLIHQSEEKTVNGGVQSAVDLTKQSAGIYFVRISSNNESITRKVVYAK